MGALTVTRDFVRSLARNIRESYGKDVSHTEAIEIVAKSLDWRPDALMHALKNAKSVEPNFEAPDDIPDDLLREWVIRRSWRRAEQATRTLIARGGDIRTDVDLAHASACLALCQAVLGDPAGALDMIRDVDSPVPEFGVAKALVLFLNDGDTQEVNDLIEGSLSGESKAYLLDLIFERKAENAHPNDLEQWGEMRLWREASGRETGSWTLDLGTFLNKLPEPEFTSLAGILMRSPSTKSYYTRLVSRQAYR